MAEFPAALDAALADWYGAGGGSAARAGGFRSRRVTPIASPVSSARGRSARMRQLEQAYGGAGKTPAQAAAAAARAAGVSPGTWRKWKTGKAAPSKRSAAGLVRAHKALLTAKDRRRSISGRAVPQRMFVRAVVVVDPGGERYVNRVQRRGFNADVRNLNLRPTAEAWARGERPGVVAMIAQQAVADAYRMEGIAFEGEASVNLS